MGDAWRELQEADRKLRQEYSSRGISVATKQSSTDAAQALLAKLNRTENKQPNKKKKNTRRKTLKATDFPWMRSSYHSVVGGCATNEEVSHFVPTTSQNQESFEQQTLNTSTLVAQDSSSFSDDTELNAIPDAPNKTVTESDTTNNNNAAGSDATNKKAAATEETKNSNNATSEKMNHAETSNETGDKLVKERSNTSCIQVPSSMTITQLLRKDVNLVDSDDPRKRFRAMQRLDELLFTSDGMPKIQDVSQLKQVFEDCMKPLLKRLGDKSEKCRENGIKLLSNFFKNVKDIGAALPYFFPAVMERCSATFDFDFENSVIVSDKEEHLAKLRGKAIPDHSIRTEQKHTVAEPSEEIRLKLCHLMWTVVYSLSSRMMHSMLGPYFHDAVLFFHASARDPFPELKVFGLACLHDIAKDQRFSHVFHFYCTPLIRSLMPALRHRHSKVRVAALNAIRELVACPYQDKCRGGGSEAIADLVGYREENVIPITAFYSGDTRVNFFGSIVTDPSATVRIAFFKLLQQWMTTLLDRWDHAARLLPYLLTGLTDTTDVIVNISLDTLDTLGAQYEEEHHDEIIDKLQYGVDGSKDLLNYDSPLPYPWSTRPRPLSHLRNSGVTHRPKLGIRLYVRNYCSRFLKPVLSELGDWRSNTKGHAVKLMLVCLVYMEEHITMDFNVLLRALVTLVSDTDIGTQVEECCRIAGKFVLPSVYLDFLTPILEGDEGTFRSSESLASKQANALKVLKNFMSSTKPKTIMSHYSRVATILGSPQLVRESTHSSALREPHIGTIDEFLTVCRVFAETGNASTDLQYTETGRLTSTSHVSSHQLLYRALLLLSWNTDHHSDVHHQGVILNALDNLSCMWDAHRGTTSKVERVTMLHQELVESTMEWLAHGSDLLEPDVSWGLLYVMQQVHGESVISQSLQLLLDIARGTLHDNKEGGNRSIDCILEHVIQHYIRSRTGVLEPHQAECILSFLLEPVFVSENNTSLCLQTDDLGIPGTWKRTLVALFENLESTEHCRFFEWIHPELVQRLRDLFQHYPKLKEDQKSVLHRLQLGLLSK